MKVESSNLICDELPCSVIEVSKERVILNCNTYASNLVKKPIDKLIGLKVDSILSLASKIFIDSYLYPLLLKDSIAKEVQITIQNIDNEKIPVAGNVFQRDDGSSIWTFFECHNRDKLYEMHLRAKDSIKEQSDELSGLYLQIKKDHSDLWVFSRSLSHDFKGPIVRAHQLILLAQEDLASKGLDIADELELLDMAQKSLKELLNLIKGLLDFISIEKKSQKSEPVQLNEVIDQAISLNKEYIESGAIVERDDLPLVQGESGQLNILFKNLIGNGLKYNTGETKVSITADLISRKDYCIVRVKDNGIGIPKDQLENIFKPFARVHTSETYEGSGLGLSIVQRIVEKHRGDIAVESEPGKGTTFIVSLPVFSTKSGMLK